MFQSIKFSSKTETIQQKLTMGHKCLFDVETSCFPFMRPAIMGNRPSTDSSPPENVSLPNDDDDDDCYDDANANDANDDHHTLKYI